MKKKFTLLFILSGIIANAQITIDDTDMPVSGDTVRMSIASPLSLVDLTQTGANYTWDFTTLVPDSQVVDSFLALSDVGVFYQISFVNLGFNANRSNVVQSADISAVPGLPVTDPYAFYYRSATDYHQTGFGGNLSGIDVPVTFNNNDVIYHFPLNFNDSDSSDSDFSVNIPGTGSLDGTQHRVNNVDGWGTLITHYGTFDVLRVTSEITAHDSISVDTLGGFTIDTHTKEYKWIGKGQIEPLLQINTRFILGTEAVTSIRYRDTLPEDSITGIHTILNASSGFNLYPNPVKEIANLQIYSKTNDLLKISITDAAGKVLKRMNVDAIHGLNEYPISTSGFSSGFYYLKAEQEGTVPKIIPMLIVK